MRVRSSARTPSNALSCQRSRELLGQAGFFPPLCSSRSMFPAYFSFFVNSLQAYLILRSALPEFCIQVLFKSTRGGHPHHRGQSHSADCVHFCVIFVLRSDPAILKI